ncbi:hypothetical protein PQJ75_22530 [Rhodoplanes sp. TEM]|uniref:Uncharacterized protein n=1 Tax=Rhodoplanes tepidamans TaxID=200616 RepID=A0ABT5JEX0_RHOTP|nr:MULTISPECIES: hypothetical protein [Rhodoplanes]MDC7788177.1 hypothetical protein [Rhodoplanes tepidamans]MDC7986514.1 hypothetical protein [Rhodoplanes sp. TEM]MDQ0355133.1 hypothetical protein [Rhodoplanes tepidamans]
MIRLISFFFTVGASAFGAALVAIQGLMFIRGDGGNALVLGAALVAMVVGLVGLRADIRRSKAAAEAMREGRFPDQWAPPRGTPKRNAPVARAVQLAAVPADPVPVVPASGGAPIADILAAERARTDAFWRDGVARLAAEAEAHGIGDGSAVLLDLAARDLARTLGARPVARILREASDRYAAEAEAPMRDAGAA